METKTKKIISISKILVIHDRNAHTFETPERVEISVMSTIKQRR